jgi:hypothetical protein
MSGSWVVWDKRANGNEDLEADKSLKCMEVHLNYVGIKK